MKRETARPTLLVLRALGLGDFLTSLPALRALGGAFPEHLRLLAAPEALRPLADLAGWRMLPFSLEPGRRVPAEAPAIAVNLHGKGPESHRALLAAKPGSVIAFRNEQIPTSIGFPVHHEHEHEVARWCRLLDESGIPADPERLDLEFPPEWLPAEAEALNGLIAEISGACVIHPGAASPARRWLPERWAQVATALRNRGLFVLLTGSAGERELCGTIGAAAGLPSRANLAGSTTLPMLGRILSKARLALSGDTGFAHLATAVGTASVTLFGPVSPALWGPPPGREQHRVIWRGISGDPHGAQPAAGLLEIEPQEVIAAADAVLGFRLVST